MLYYNIDYFNFSGHNMKKLLLLLLISVSAFALDTKYILNGNDSIQAQEVGWSNVITGEILVGDGNNSMCYTNLVTVITNSIGDLFVNRHAPNWAGTVVSNLQFGGKNIYNVDILNVNRLVSDTDIDTNKLSDADGYINFGKIADPSSSFRSNLYSSINFGYMGLEGDETPDGSTYQIADGVAAINLGYLIGTTKQISAGGNSINIGLVIDSVQLNSGDGAVQIGSIDNESLQETTGAGSLNVVYLDGGYSYLSGNGSMNLGGNISNTFDCSLVVGTNLNAKLADGITTRRVWLAGSVNGTNYAVPVWYLQNISNELVKFTLATSNSLYAHAEYNYTNLYIRIEGARTNLINSDLNISNYFEAAFTNAYAHTQRNYTNLFNTDLSISNYFEVSFTNAYVHTQRNYTNLKVRVENVYTTLNVRAENIYTGLNIRTENVYTNLNIRTENVYTNLNIRTENIYTNLDAAKVNRSGDVMTGSLWVSNTLCIYDRYNANFDYGTNSLLFSNIYSSAVIREYGDYNIGHYIEIDNDTAGTADSVIIGESIIDVNTRKIINMLDPTTDQDSATKIYVDTQDAATKIYVDTIVKETNEIVTIALNNKVNRRGDTMTGPLTNNTFIAVGNNLTGTIYLSYGPSSNAAIKAYTVGGTNTLLLAENAYSTKPILIQTNIVNFNNRRLTDLKDPIDNQDAVTKKYSDGMSNAFVAMFGHTSNLVFISPTATVNGNGQFNSPYNTIYAITNSPYVNKCVVLLPGTYYTSDDIIMGASYVNVTIKGIDKNTTKIRSSSGNKRIFTLNYSVNTVIENLTLTSTNTIDNGGAMYWGTANNCIFLNCYSSGFGGAAAEIYANNCIFTSCAADAGGGGVYNYLLTTTISINNCKFSSCRAVSVDPSYNTGVGAAVYRGRVMNSIIENCYGNNIVKYNQVDAVLYNCYSINNIIIDNTTYVDAGDTALYGVNIINSKTYGSFTASEP